MSGDGIIYGFRYGSGGPARLPDTRAMIALFINKSTIHIGRLADSIVVNPFFGFGLSGHHARIGDTKETRRQCRQYVARPSKPGGRVLTAIEQVKRFAVATDLLEVNHGARCERTPTPARES